MPLPRNVQHAAGFWTVKKRSAVSPTNKRPSHTPTSGRQVCMYPIQLVRSWLDLQLDDLTRNHGVFIERVDGAEPMIAVRDDHFAFVIFPDEK